jgi:acyl-CoA hydrolase
MAPDEALPPQVAADPAPEPGVWRTVETVFPGATNHYGTLFGGDALKVMGTAAFVAATRTSREVMVMAATNRIDFRSPVRGGDMIELASRVTRVGRSSLTVEVALHAEALLTGERRRSAVADFVMVAVDAAGRPKPIAA